MERIVAAAEVTHSLAKSELIRRRTDFWTRLSSVAPTNSG